MSKRYQNGIKEPHHFSDRSDAVCFIKNADALLLAEEVVAAAVHRVFLVPLFADAVIDEFSDRKQRGIADRFKEYFAEINCDRLAVHRAPEPLEEEQDNQQETEVQEEIQQPESP